LKKAIEDLQLPNNKAIVYEMLGNTGY